MAELDSGPPQEGEYPGKEPAGADASITTLIRLGLPVPPAFVVTSSTGTPLSRLVCAMEQRAGRTFGRSTTPMLLSAQLETEHQMPGIVTPIAYIGLNDESVVDFATWTRDESFAWQAYCSFVASFGTAVLGIKRTHFDRALHAAQAGHPPLNTKQWRDLLETFKDIVADTSRRPLPQDPHEQLDLAIRALLDASDSSLIRAYRLSSDARVSTAKSVSVKMMVFSDIGADCGVGVVSTRDSSTGSSELSGIYLPNSLGEDLFRETHRISVSELRDRSPAVHRELLGIRETLEQHFRDLCDAEFVIERNKLWILRARVGRRTAASAFRVAAALRSEGMIDDDETVRRVSGGQLTQLMFSRFVENADRRPLTTGIAASPGAAVGHAVFDSTTAVRWASDGKPVILIRQETSPADVDGMIHSSGVLTSRGGQTSHAQWSPAVSGESVCAAPHS